MHAGVINADQAELISATRLGRVLVEDLAAKAGIAASVLRMRRRRAELAVVRALTDGDLSGIAFVTIYAKYRYKLAQQKVDSTVAWPTSKKPPRHAS